MPKETFKMTYVEARSLMDAAVQSTFEHKVPGAIAIVDAGGNLLLVETLDNTMSSGADIAIGKAATSVSFRRPTMDLENVILEGRTPMLVLESATPHAYTPLKGGYPIWFQDELVGGIGVSGTMDAEMDEIVVLEAIKNKRW